MISNDTDNDKDVEHVSANASDEDEDGDEDIVMKLKFSELSIQTEQLFTDIMKEEKAEEEETNSSSRRRPNSRASLSLVGDDGASARRSSIISLRPSIMSKETAQKVIDVLLEVENADQEINCSEIREDGISLNNDEQEWDTLSLEQKISKLKCAAAGGGLVLLGIITTPTPFPTLPFIAAGFHVLANEFEQAKEAEEMLFEKVDIAKTAVIEKYEKFNCLQPSTLEPNLNMNKNSTEFVKSSNEFSNFNATIPIKDDNELE
jgi:hypothetical protein